MNSSFHPGGCAEPLLPKRSSERGLPINGYECTLTSGKAWHGYTDFLVRVEQPSSLGPWSFDVHGAKLASVKVKFAIHLA